MTKQYSIKDVAVICGKKAFQVNYAIANGYVPEPVQRIANRRIFSEQELLNAKTYFANESKAKKEKKK